MGNSASSEASPIKSRSDIKKEYKEKKAQRKATKKDLEERWKASQSGKPIVTSFLKPKEPEPEPQPEPEPEPPKVKESKKLESKDKLKAIMAAK